MTVLVTQGSTISKEVLRVRSKKNEREKERTLV